MLKGVLNSETKDLILNKELEELQVENFKKFQGHREDYRKYNYAVNCEGFGGCMIQVCGLITGCGIAQMYGISGCYNNASQEEFKNNVLPVITEVWRKNVGGILCTLGRDFVDKYENFVLSLGFQQIAEYSNYHHDITGQERQKLYILYL